MKTALSKFKDHVYGLRGEIETAKTDAMRYRLRFEEAEKKVAELEQELAENQAAISALESMSTKSEDWREPRDEDGYRKPE